MERKSILELLRKIIREETRFHRHYIAKVTSIDDPDKKGKVRATVPSLGWDTDDVAPWIYPRTINGIQFPKVGQWIEIYFLNGNKNTAVYIGQAVEMENSLPSLSAGDTNKQVIFEDPDDLDGIIYFKKEKILDILGKDGAVLVIKKKDGKIEMFGATESAVLGNTLDGYLSGLKTWADAHTHPTPAGASSAPTAPSPSIPDILSDKVILE